jgi:hypothetical protein
MALYLIMLQSGSFDESDVARMNELCASVKELTAGSRLLDCSRTSQEISEAVFPRNDQGKAAKAHIVLGIGPWWGFYDTTVWEWLKTHRGSGNA